MAKLSNLKALRSGDTIVLHYNSETLNIQRSSRPADFKRVEKLLEANDLDALVKAFIDIKAAIEKYTKDKMTVDAGILIDKQTGETIPAAIAKKLMQMKNKQSEFLPLWRFWQKLKKNPSKNSVQQLYTFITKNEIPITELGDLVLEKGVREQPDGSLRDCHKGIFDNSVGMVVEMKREDVVDDPQQTCSAGLHVAAPKYVRNIYSNDTIIEVIVNPADVVSVPVDYDATKMRVCRYQVMGIAKKSSRTEHIVKLEDFTELPRNESDTEDLNTETDLMKLTAKKIISYVRKTTGKRITLNLKNKQGIAKRAEEILKKHQEVKGPKVKTFIVTGMKCDEIITAAGNIIGLDKAAILAGNSPRRARFIAKVTPILKEKGYSIKD